jgi:hypothetical protein
VPQFRDRRGSRAARAVQVVSNVDCLLALHVRTPYVGTQRTGHELLLCSLKGMRGLG